MLYSVHGPIRFHTIHRRIMAIMDIHRTIIHISKKIRPIIKKSNRIRLLFLCVYTMD